MPSRRVVAGVSLLLLVAGSAFSQVAPVEAAGPSVKVSLRKGVLTVVGTAKKDEIVVKRQGTKLVVTARGPVRRTGSQATVGNTKRISVKAGGGNDVVYFTGKVPKVVVRGGGGKDALSGGPKADKILGGPGTDNLDGGGGKDRIDGGTGTDFLLGGPDADALVSGPDGDELVGGGGNDVAAGGAGDDAFFDDDGDDLLLGEGDNDYFGVLRGNDRAEGGPGNDLYELDSEASTFGTATLVEGPGAGVDYLNFEYELAPVTVDLSKTAPQAVPAGTVVLSDPSTFEALIGGEGSDVLTGNTAANYFYAKFGKDVVVHHGPGDGVDTFADPFVAQGDTVRFATDAVQASLLDLVDPVTLRSADGSYGFDFGKPLVNPNGMYTYGWTGITAPGELTTWDGTNGFIQGEAGGGLLTSYRAQTVMLSGGPGNERIVDQSAYGNNLYGRGGNDVLVGGAGPDIVSVGQQTGTATPALFGNDSVVDFATEDTVDLQTGLSVRSGLGTLTVTIWNGATNYGTITATNGRVWQPADFG